MTLSKADCDALRPLIPLYVKSTLTDTQRKKLETSFNECPELKNEIEEWQEIQCAYKEIEKNLPEPEAYLSARVMQQIRETKSAGFFERTFPPGRWSFALIAAQLLIIIALGIYTIHLRTTYRTLSAPAITNEQLIKINVVFKGETTETEIRSLLSEINGRILDGPSGSGLYVIGVAPGKNIENVLKRLKEDRIIAFAEKTY
jgi:hypothetical protein